MSPVLEVLGLARHYRVRTGLFRPPALVRALDGVSFALEAGQVLAVVGESGCGKSTLSRVVSLLEPPTSGTLLIGGRPAATPAEVKALRRQVQMVFQNPLGALNPRKTVGQSLAEPLAIHRRGDRREREAAARAMLDKVGLRQDQHGRYPHMLSGGQRQRVAIGRALMLRPPVVVADEPASALDLSIQAQILNLMMDLKDELGLAYLFISHDLAVVRHIADAVLVMYLGRAVEQGPRDAILGRPRHPYTRLLLAATPSLDPARRPAPAGLGGEPPSPLDQPRGCAFLGRCPHATERCAEEPPALRWVEDRLVACHHAERLGT